MSPQAKNSIALYRGNHPSKIKMLLQIQSTSVVKELEQHFGVNDIDALAVRLSLA